MGLQIEDGQGKANIAGVTDENRLKVSSMSFPLEHEINHHDGESYSIPTSVTPTAGASTPTCILYIKNTSDMDMVVSEFMLAVMGTDTTVSMKLGDSGTPSNTAAVTPVNRNAGSGNEADVTAYHGADGAGIGGISGGSTFMGVVVRDDAPSQYYAPLSAFIVPKNKVFTLWASGNCTNLLVGVGVSFHKPGH